MSYCSEENSTCSIETSNLDGETNLKIKQVLLVSANKNRTFRQNYVLSFF